MNCISTVFQIHDFQLTASVRICSGNTVTNIHLQPVNIPSQYVHEHRIPRSTSYTLARNNTKYTYIVQISIMQTDIIIENTILHNDNGEQS
jgi:hypothetical protein